MIVILNSNLGSGGVTIRVSLTLELRKHEPIMYYQCIYGSVLQVIFTLTERSYC
jgi:hypothetical protein